MGEHYSTVGPICPHCQHQDHADEPFYYDEGMTGMQCESCGRYFDMRVFTQTSWTTSEPDHA